MCLEIQPELSAVAEIQPQAQSCIGGDPATVVHDLGDAIRRIPIAFASLFCDSPYSAKNSSFSISPGVTGANSFFMEIL